MPAPAPAARARLRTHLRLRRHLHAPLLRHHRRAAVALRVLLRCLRDLAEQRLLPLLHARRVDLRLLPLLGLLHQQQRLLLLQQALQ